MSFSIPEVKTSWEVAPHLGQEFLALDSDSEMVVGKLVLCRMDRACAEGRRGWIKLKARKFLPLRESSDENTVNQSSPPKKQWESTPVHTKWVLFLIQGRIDM